MGNKLKFSKFFFLTFVIITMSACFSAKYVNYYYSFSDNTSRNIQIVFRDDSTFFLRNAVTGSRAFSFTGKWKKLKENTIVINNPYVKINKVDNKEGNTDKHLDSLSAEISPYQIFPMIESDTAILSTDKKYVLFKGYNFKKTYKIEE